MSYTYKDNEKVALDIVRNLRGKVLHKIKGMNESCGVIFTCRSNMFDLERNIGDYIENVIGNINPNYKLDKQWGQCAAIPREATADSSAVTYTIRDEYYDNKDDDYYGTEIYLAACDTPSASVYVVTVCLEGE